MWKIQKPEINDALADIDTIREKEIISDADAVALKILVKQYDVQTGMITNQQHSTISTNGVNSIFKHYSDTESGESLNYIRQQLNEGVAKCPYCAIGQPNTLDHYMPKSKYKALALCRLNLIPMCWECNRTKGYTHPYSEFIHPYYISVKPGNFFLISNIQIIGDILVFTFSFDKNVLTNQQLYTQFTTHWKNLKLDCRLKKSVIDFVHNRFATYTNNADVLLEYIPIIKNEIEMEYGLNNWRSAVVRALVKELNGSNKDLILKNLTLMGKAIKDINL